MQKLVMADRTYILNRAHKEHKVLPKPGKRGNRGEKREGRKEKGGYSNSRKVPKGKPQPKIAAREKGNIIVKEPN